MRCIICHHLATTACVECNAPTCDLHRGTWPHTKAGMPVIIRNVGSVQFDQVVRPDQPRVRR